MKDYYNEIDKALKSYEDYKPYHIHDIDWICNRIGWCWKFRHITPEQKNDLCSRAIDIMDRQKFF